MKTSFTYRVSKRRSGLRAAGLRPGQIWVPDTRSPEFAEECRRQSRLLRDDPQEQEIAEWMAAVADRMVGIEALATYCGRPPKRGKNRGVG